MKKLLLTSLVLIIATVSLSAQTEYGTRAGFYKNHRQTNGSFPNDGLSEGNLNEGFYIGAFVGLKISERFYVQPEITYAFINNDFNQLHIPVLGRYRIGKKFNVFLGPNFGFLLTDNENFKKLNFGVTFGVSYQLMKKLNIDFRYSWIFTESFKTDFGGTTVPSAKFIGFQIGLTYRLD